MVLLVCVVDNPCHLDAVLDAWMAAGIRGITILDSSGVHRRLGKHQEHVNPPTFLGLGRLLLSEQYEHNTLFSIVEDESILPRVVEATQEIVGDLRAPHTGLMFTLPIQNVWGIPKAKFGEMDHAAKPCKEDAIEG